MNESIIYLVQCTTDLAKLYVGKTDRALERRKIEHERAARDGSPTVFHRALLDEGLKHWEWRVLETCSPETVSEREQFWIKKFGALSIDLQNTAHTRCDAKARIVRRSAIGNKLGGMNVWKKPSAREWLIRSGKLRPLTNLTTGKKYASLSEAARNETHDDRPGIKRACDTGRPTLSGTSYAWLSLDGEPQLTEGHKKNLPRTRRVKDVLTGKVYESAGAAARGLGVSLSSVQGTCAGKYKTCQGTGLCYLDDDGNEQLTATHTQYRKEREEADRFAFAAYRIEDVAFEKPLRFDSIKELAATLGIPLAHIPAVIKGERRQVKGYRVARWDKLKSEPELTESHMKPVMLKGMTRDLP